MTCASLPFAGDSCSVHWCWVLGYHCAGCGIQTAQAQPICTVCGRMTQAAHLDTASPAYLACMQPAPQCYSEQEVLHAQQFWHMYLCWVFSRVHLAVVLCVLGGDLQGGWHARMMEVIPWHTQPSLLSSTTDPDSHYLGPTCTFHQPNYEHASLAVLEQCSGSLSCMAWHVVLLVATPYKASGEC